MSEVLKVSEVSKVWRLEVQRLRGERLSFHHGELCELQQQLLAASVAELHCCFSILTAALELHHCAYAEALMLYDATLAQSPNRG